MDETSRLAGLIQERITDRLDEHRQALEPLGPDILPLLDEARGFLTGGKRFRAQFAIQGYRAIRPFDIHGAVGPEYSRVLDAACALELFHAAALIHDDVIDRSDTRRGRPASHKIFSSLHATHGLRGGSDHFGLSGAILLGDLLQSWADELLQHACDATDDPAASRAARDHFNRMRSEVAAGQYLDVWEEQQPNFAEHAAQLERSTRVLVYKSAKYSVESPLLIGAALAGADDDQEAALSNFGLPIGVAFQLRDDLLGVFGDEEVTGKPSGGDLVEGKRTVLATLARHDLPSTQRLIFDELIGSSEMTADQVRMLQQTIRDSGAVQHVEQMISRNVERAIASLEGAPLHKGTVQRLAAMAEQASQRVS